MQTEAMNIPAAPIDISAQDLYEKYNALPAEAKTAFYGLLEGMKVASDLQQHRAVEDLNSTESTAVTNSIEERGNDDNV